MVAPEIYFSKDGGDTSPEKQFVNALKARKVACLSIASAGKRVPNVRVRMNLGGSVAGS